MQSATEGSGFRRFCGMGYRAALIGLCWVSLMSGAFAASVTYTVKSGDNPWGIAQKFKVDVAALLKANNLSEDAVLHIGQKITIPVKDTAGTAATGEVPERTFEEYAVARGDTLSEIAEAHAVSLRELLDANGLVENSMLKVGLVLRIPIEIIGADAPADPNPDGGSHTLTKGESLWTVARDYGVTVRDLAAFNRIAPSQVLMPGVVLLIPGAADLIPAALPKDNIDPAAPIVAGAELLSLASADAAPVAEPKEGIVTHVVENGDTVSHLAVKYRTTRQAIFEVNRLAARDVLSPGAKLLIPQGSLDAEHARAAGAKDAVRSKNELPSRASSMGQRVAKYAVGFLGTPYKWAGEDLKRGVDCSGFVLAVYKNFGQSLPHNSKQQATVGRAVKRSELQPGDIILFHTTRSGISHAGLYIGNNQFVHASTNQRKVRIDSLSDAYYDRGYVCARRIF